MITSTLITLALAEYASRDDFHQIGKGSKIRHGLQWLFRAAVVALACYLDDCTLYAVPLAFLFSAAFRWRLNGLRGYDALYLGPTNRGFDDSWYDAVFVWATYRIWNKSGQDRYKYRTNRAGTMAYTFEAACFVAGTVILIYSNSG